MLTANTLNNIRRGGRITFFNGIYAIIFGVLYLIFINFLLKMNFKAVSVVWQVFAKYNPAINLLFVKLIILKAVFIIIIGIAIMYLSSYIIKRKDKTAWVVLFIIGLIFWGALLTVEILDKNLYTGILAFIGWLVFIIGMLVPIKYYFQRDYEDY